MNFYKTYVKVFNIVLSIAGVAGSSYVLVKKYMLKKSKEADNKLKYISFKSDDDDFIIITDDDE